MSDQIARTLYQQLGGQSLHGALVLTGARNVVSYPDDLNMPRVEPDDKGWMTCANGLAWQPNVNARGVKFIIVLQPSDTYTIWLYKVVSRNSAAFRDGYAGTVLDKRDDVYFDQLIEVVDRMYVRYIEKYQDGFIRC